MQRSYKFPEDPNKTTCNDQTKLFTDDNYILTVFWPRKNFVNKAYDISDQTISFWKERSCQHKFREPKSLELLNNQEGKIQNSI